MTAAAPRGLTKSEWTSVRDRLDACDDLVRALVAAMATDQLVQALGSAAPGVRELAARIAAGQAPLELVRATLRVLSWNGVGSYMLDPEGAR